MNSLLIDDLRIPGDARNKKNIPADAVVARNYADGIKLLQAGCHGEPFDVPYLDPDLAALTRRQGDDRLSHHVLVGRISAVPAQREHHHRLRQFLRDASDAAGDQQALRPGLLISLIIKPETNYEKRQNRVCRLQ